MNTLFNEALSTNRPMCIVKLGLLYISSLSSRGARGRYIALERESEKSKADGGDGRRKEEGGQMEEKVDEKKLGKYNPM